MAAFDSWESADYDAANRRMEPALPERKLLRAVLADAMDTLLKSTRARDRRTLKARCEALDWVVSRSHSETFAFESICETLGLDAGSLRARVLRTLDHRAHAAAAGD